MTHEERNLNRREFIRLGAAGVAAASVGDLSGLAAEAVGGGKLPKRRYGRTGLEISRLVGAADWSRSIIPLAVASGVNYWHKAQKWTAETMPEALKQQPRESYYLEVVVDRVGGDHNHGRIDEEQHYQFVKESVKNSGLGYYDVFKFHFGYHSIKEAKTNHGMVRAFERLKREGLVRHLALSQHHYNNLGGDMAWEILGYLAEHSAYEAGQFFYTYGDRKELQELLELAGRKDFGTIAMKTMGGVGRAAQDPKFQKLLAESRFKGSTPAAAMVRWLGANPNLSAAVVSMKSFGEFQENVGAAMRLAMGPHDRSALGLLSSYNKGLTCLLCSQCVSRCPEHIGIADVFRYERYARDYQDLSRARREYAALTKNGTSCVGCGDCVDSCPHEIDVAAKLKEVHRLLG
jgi:predicted aldo/keto reductase-like oxidoreductase